MVDPELVAIDAEAPARLTDLGVMPEPGGEGEEPQPDAGAQARECAGAVALEAELSLAGPKNRSDPLAHAPERSELERLVLAIGTKELGSAIGHPALELGAGGALVGDDGEAGERDPLEHLARDLSLGSICRGELEGDRPPAIWNQSSRPARRLLRRLCGGAESSTSSAPRRRRCRWPSSR